jgi:hypothetical protein
MKRYDTPKHPGPWRMMRVDTGVAGIVIAVAFLLMGFVSMPVAAWFVLGTITLGVVFALLLRLTLGRFTRLVAGTVIILAAAALWWVGHKPRRPRTVSSNALYVLPNNVPFTLGKTGYWVDCWFDGDSSVDRCKLTNEGGTVSFEDVFLPCIGETPVPRSELTLDTWRTGSKWTLSPDRRINTPIVYLEHGQVLLPQSFYAEAKRTAEC